MNIHEVKIENVVFCDKDPENGKSYYQDEIFGETKEKRTIYISKDKKWATYYFPFDISYDEIRSQCNPNILQAIPMGDFICTLNIKKLTR